MAASPECSGQSRKHICLFIMARTSETNPSKLSATFKSVKNKSISNTMIKNYIDYLKICGFNVDVGVVVVNGTDKKGNGTKKQFEIDFACNKGSKRYWWLAFFCFVQL